MSRRPSGTRGRCGECGQACAPAEGSASGAGVTGLSAPGAAGLQAAAWKRVGRSRAAVPRVDLRSTYGVLPVDAGGISRVQLRSARWYVRHPLAEESACAIQPPDQRSDPAGASSGRAGARWERSSIIVWQPCRCCDRRGRRRRKPAVPSEHRREHRQAWHRVLRRKAADQRCRNCGLRVRWRLSRIRWS